MLDIDQNIQIILQCFSNLERGVKNSAAVSWGVGIIISTHQYLLYWIIEFCIREEEAHNEAVLELGVEGGEPGLFAYPKYHRQEHDEVFDLFLPCFNGFDPTDINIVLLQGMFEANAKLNKAIIDRAPSAVVPAKSAAGEPVDKSFITFLWTGTCWTLMLYIVEWEMLL